MLRIRDDNVLRGTGVVLHVVRHGNLSGDDTTWDDGREDNSPRISRRAHRGVTGVTEPRVGTKLLLLPCG